MGRGAVVVKTFRTSHGIRTTAALALLASLAACGETSKTPTTVDVPAGVAGAPAAGSTGGGTAGAGSTTSTGGGSTSGGAEQAFAGEDGGGAGGTGSMEPVADECVFVGQWAIAPSDYHDGVRLNRLPDGFGFTSDGLEFGVISEHRSEVFKLRLDIQDPTTLLSSFSEPHVAALSGTAAAPRVLGAHVVSLADFVGAYVLAYDADGSPHGEQKAILETYQRVTARNRLAVSFDGKVAAYGNYHPGIWDPRLIMLDGDGRPQGSPVRLLDTGDRPTVDCFALTPTEGGVLATFVYGSPAVMRLVEVSSTGEVSKQVEWQVPARVRCENAWIEGSTPWQEASGTLLPFTGLDDHGEPVSREIYRYAAGEVVKVLSWPTGAGVPSYLWLQDGPAPLVVRDDELGRVREGLFVALRAPALPRFTTALPAVDGRVFVADVWRTVGHDLRVYEIRCAEGG
jgi:hypothetical protein